MRLLAAEPRSDAGLLLPYQDHCDRGDPAFDGVELAGFQLFLSFCLFGWTGVFGLIFVNHRSLPSINDLM